jgi:hypothetical protein
MKILQHDFTKTIINILNNYFPGYGNIILSILQTVYNLTKYVTSLVNLSPHPSLTLPYKGGKRSSFEPVRCIIKKVY